MSEARASSSSGSALAFDRLGARQQLLDRRGVERLEHQHARAREQRRVQLERRVFGGGADQHDGAVLHHRQERVLLRAVEAVDLVDEQQRPLPGLAPRARRVEHFLEVGDAGEDRGNLLEMQLGGVGEQPRDRGLAGAGRPPEDQRAERAGVEHARERAVGAEQMVLPDHLRERRRPQPVGQRPRRIALKAGGREQGWALAGRFAIAQRWGIPAGTSGTSRPEQGRRRSSRQSRAKLRAANPTAEIASSNKAASASDAAYGRRAAKQRRDPHVRNVRGELHHIERESTQKHAEARRRIDSAAPYRSLRSGWRPIASGDRDARHSEHAAKCQHLAIAGSE